MMQRNNEENNEDFTGYFTGRVVRLRRDARGRSVIEGNERTEVNAQEYLDENFPQDITEKKKRQEEHAADIESSLFDFDDFNYMTGMSTRIMRETEVKERKKIKELVLPDPFGAPGFSWWGGKKLGGNLDLSDFVKLEELKITGELANLNISSCSRLKSLECSDNKLTDLDLSNCRLGGLDCRGNQLTSLNLEKGSQLKELKCSNNQIKSLDLSNCPNLEVLICKNNQLTSLDLRNNKKLKKINVSGNSITSEIGLFSHLVDLKTLFLSNEPNSKREVEITEKENDFRGSLTDLKTCASLEVICLSNQQKITGNHKFFLYLLSGSLKKFFCQNTTFEAELSPLNYDVPEWKAFNITGLEAEITKKVERIAWLENELDIEQNAKAKHSEHFHQMQLRSEIEAREVAEGNAEYWKSHVGAESKRLNQEIIRAKEWEITTLSDKILLFTSIFFLVLY